MDSAQVILESLVDGQPEPAMGSEYSCARRYLARFDAQQARESDAASHGANESDFGAGKLGVD